MRLRSAEERDREVARELLETVARQAPRWTPALRALDDLKRFEGNLGSALEERLTELEASPGDVVALYLVGRLEGSEGADRFSRAVQIDPNFAWGHHGVAWALAQSKQTDRAIGVEERAMELAATPTERAIFAGALARYLAYRDNETGAAELLTDMLETEELDRVAHLELSIELALYELQLGEEGRRGVERALTLIAEEDLSESELQRLALRLQTHVALTGASSMRAVDGLLEIAIAARPGPGRASLQARLAGREANDLFLAGLVAETSDNVAVEDRVLSFLVRGQVRRALEHWLAEQPRAVLDAAGQPVRLELRELLQSAQMEPLDERAFGAKLMAAGWFAEARAYSGPLSVIDLEAGQKLRSQATRELAFLEGLGGVLIAIDNQRAYGGPFADGSLEPRKLDSLDDLLDATEGLLRQVCHEDISLGDSPREKHGPFAEVVVPGPVYTERDEARGAGTAGEIIPGLADVLARRGRFGIFGKAVGTGGPDASVLRLLATEMREGKHLGVHYTGLCAWCDGADLVSRPERRGARIGGAALHEGWWVDVSSARRSLLRWNRLESLLNGAGGDRIRTDLAGRGPKLSHYPTHSATDLVGTSGLGDRLRLSLLAERMADGKDSELVDLDEILAVTTTHEEGHLCDRTRFLPITKHFGAILGLFWKAGGKPQRIAELLEYRAQLTAVAACEDPRLALAQCLDRLDNPSALTPHDAGYAKLVAEFLDALQLRRAEFTQLDEEHFLVHQLHLLRPEVIRSLARDVARSEGMLVE